MPNRKVRSSFPEEETSSTYSLQDVETLITQNLFFLDKLSAENVNMHCDTVYTGSHVRIWHPVTKNPDGRVAYVNWGYDKGIYVSLKIATGTNWFR